MNHHKQLKINKHLRICCLLLKKKVHVENTQKDKRKVMKTALEYIQVKVTFLKQMYQKKNLRKMMKQIEEVLSKQSKAQENNKIKCLSSSSQS